MTELGVSEFGEVEDVSTGENLENLHFPQKGSRW